MLRPSIGTQCQPLPDIVDRRPFAARAARLTCLMVLGFTLGCAPSESAHVGESQSGHGKTTAKQTNHRIKNPPNVDHSVPSANSSSKPEIRGTNQPNNQPTELTSQPVVNNPAFHKSITAAVDDYFQYAMVNSVALESTDGDPPDGDSQPRMSQSNHQPTHGNKLYYLFAKDIEHYLSQDGTESPEGQLLVMETWTSKISNPEARNRRTHSAGVRINPRTSVGEQVLEIGKRSNLYIMMKLESDAPDTDQGWVYGIVDAESKSVTAAGNVLSCRRCHSGAKNDRLFGPKSEN